MWAGLLWMRTIQSSSIRIFCNMKLQLIPVFRKWSTFALRWNRRLVGPCEVQSCGWNIEITASFQESWCSGQNYGEELCQEDWLVNFIGRASFSETESCWNYVQHQQGADLLPTPHPLHEQIDHSSQPVTPPPEGKTYNDRIAIGSLDPLAAEKWLPTGRGALNLGSP